MIQLFKPFIHEEAIQNVEKVLRSGWIGLGPKVAEFEEKFAKYIGNQYAVAFNSCTEALRAAIELSGIPPRSIILSTPLTFVATNHVILQTEHTPIFADIDLINGNLSYKSIRNTCRIWKPKAIMVVHFGGFPLRPDFLYEIADEYKCIVIEDCAHACGALWERHRIGYNSKFACYSFHAVKNMPTGDGGMLVTNDEEVAVEAKKFRWFGVDNSTTDRMKNRYSWRYNVEFLGYKSYMNDIVAAIGLGQLPHLDNDNAYRHQIFEQYNDVFRSQMIHETAGTESSHHLAVFLAKDRQQKEDIVANLTKHDIQYGVHYLPNYYYPMYKDVWRDGGCKETEEFYQRCISLPNHLYLTSKDIEYVIKCIKEVL